MTTVIDAIAGLVGLLHVYIFYMESLAWGKPAINKKFRQTAATAETTRLLAFNQGFYNLFLAIAIFTGLVLLAADRVLQGRTLIDYATASVAGAGIVLMCSGKGMWKGAVIQIVPAALYLSLRFAFL